MLYFELEENLFICQHYLDYVERCENYMMHIPNYFWKGNMTNRIHSHVFPLNSKAIELFAGTNVAASKIELSMHFLITNDSSLNELFSVFICN